MTETTVVVEQARDWLDLLAIAFGCLGGLAGLVALLVARQSRTDSRRSADAAESARDTARATSAASVRTAAAAARTAEAAEEEARISREQLEMLRADRAARPRFVLDAENLVNSWAAHVLRITMLNDGDRDALRAVLKIYVPDDVTIRPCANEEGDGAWAIPSRWGMPPEPHPNAPSRTSWHVYISETDLPMNTPTDAYFVTDLPDGWAPAMIVLEHGAAEPAVSVRTLE